MTKAFCRFLLRTTDPDSARGFYSRLLGPEFWGRGIDVDPLPPQAIARGAVPHWLGHIGVDDVAATMERFVSRGASPLGPTPRDGVPCILRDPFGAIVALLEVPRAEIRNDRVPWHMLHVTNEADAMSTYAEIFGWTPVGARESGDRQREQIFAWDGGTTAAGSIANTASLPGVHSHWMFFFRCAPLEETLRDVRELGGLALPMIERPDGSRVAACEDPQHAAFGLYQSPTP